MKCPSGQHYFLVIQATAGWEEVLQELGLTYIVISFSDLQFGFLYVYIALLR